MKVAITGKGGVGKTTLSSTLARLYADEGRTVLAADVDPDANLGLALGLTQEEVDEIIPISKISVAFGGGGVEFGNKKTTGERPYGGGNATGVKVDPIGFLVIKEGTVRMINVTPPASNTVDRIIDMVPQVMDRVDAFIAKQKQGK